MARVQWSRRTVLIAGAVIAALVGGIVLITSTGSDSAGKKPKAKPAHAATLALEPGQRSTTPFAVFEDGAFIVTVGTAVYDKQNRGLFVGTRWHNVSTHYARPSAAVYVVPKPQATETVMSLDGPYAVPPGRTADITVSQTGIDDDPLIAGSLVFGTPSEARTTVNLADGRGIGQTIARPVKFSGWAQFGTHTIHVTKATLGVAKVNDDAQASSGHRILHVDFDQWASKGAQLGFVTADYLQLRLPDGTTVKAVDGVTILGQSTWSAFPGLWADFEVPIAATGHYELWLMRRGPGVLDRVVVNNTHEPLPFEITSASLLGPTSVQRPTAGAAPLPRVLPRIDPSAPRPAALQPVETDLHTASVNAPGFMVSMTHATWDRDKHSLVLAGSATYIGPPAGTSIFDSATALNLNAALESANYQLSWATISASGFASSPTQPIMVRFDNVRVFDPRTAVVYLGNTAVLPLKDSTATGNPPTERKALAATKIIAGEFTAHVVSYRGGLLTKDDVAPGFTQLEVNLTLTTSTAKSYKTTHVRISHQLFISRVDGYLQQCVPPTDDLVELKVGVPLQIRVVFVVPDKPIHTLYLALRSRDETDFLYPAGWIETTFPITFTNDAA